MDAPTCAAPVFLYVIAIPAAILAAWFLLEAHRWMRVQTALAQTQQVALLCDSVLRVIKQASVAWSEFEQFQHATAA